MAVFMVLPQHKGNLENRPLDINVGDVIQLRYVCLIGCNLSCVLTTSYQHFINECPERTKPPEGYVCKICNTVSATLFLFCRHYFDLSSSPATLSVIAPQEMRLVIRAVANLEKDMSAEHADRTLII